MGTVPDTESVPNKPRLTQQFSTLAVYRNTGEGGGVQFTHPVAQAEPQTNQIRISRVGAQETGFLKSHQAIPVSGEVVIDHLAERSNHGAGTCFVNTVWGGDRRRVRTSQSGQLLSRSQTWLKSSGSFFKILMLDPIPRDWQSAWGRSWVWVWLSSPRVTLKCTQPEWRKLLATTWSCRPSPLQPPTLWPQHSSFSRAPEVLHLLSLNRAGTRVRQARRSPWEQN